MSKVVVQVADYVEDLRHTIQVAALNFDIWWAYKQRRDRARFVDVLNTYPLFFQTSIQAHFAALVVALYHVYETRSDTFNVPRLLLRLENERALPRRTLASIRRREATAKKLWIKVCVLRHKAIAHRANTYSFADVYREAQVKPNDLRRLLKQTQRLLNRITRALDRSSHAFNLRALKDTRRMLADLKAYNIERSNKPLHRPRGRAAGR